MEYFTQSVLLYGEMGTKFLCCRTKRLKHIKGMKGIAFVLIQKHEHFNSKGINIPVRFN